MNWKSTVCLVLLASSAGVWLWKGDDWSPKLGLPTNASAPVESPSLATLTKNFTPEKIGRIEIVGDATTALTLEKAEGDIGWKLPGNWPLRKQEVAELVALFSDLRTRFQAIPLAENEDLTRYGLGAASKPLEVKVTSGGTLYTLHFGEAKLAAGDSPFTRSAFLRINENQELLRLGPDVMPVLRRSPDSYRRRQLFPESERVKIGSSAAASPFGPSAGGSSTATILTDKVKEIEARSTGRSVKLFGAAIPRIETYTIKRTAPFPKPVAAEKGGEAVVQSQRIADAWELAVPQRDRLDPEKLQRILTTIPDLWVEEFATDASKAGLDKPERTLIVTNADGSKLSLLVGAVAKTVEREETVSAPPPMPGFPPSPTTRKVSDEYRYAKLADNPQVFVLRADKLADLFAKAESLRDPQLARFSSDEVQEVSVAVPGKPATKFIRKDGKWLLDAKPEPLAVEQAVVNALVAELSGLRSSGAEPAGTPDGGTIITVIAKEKRPDDQPAAAPRTIVVHLGRPKLGPWPAIASATSALVAVGVGANAESESIPARVEGWPRIAAVDAAILKVIAPEGGFRDRTLTAFTGADKLILEREGKVFSFTKTGAIWKQTAPKDALVEQAELEELAGVLGRLKAEKFVAENASPEELKKFGLDAPKAKWTAFAGGKDLLVLLVGTKDAEGKAYAKLATGNAVAVLSLEASTKALADYRSRKVWDLEEAKVESIEVEKAGKKFKFVRKGTGWEDPAALKDTVDDRAVDVLLATLAGMKVDSWIGDKPDDVKKAGLEKPSGSIALAMKDGTKRVLLLGSFQEGFSKKLFAKAGDPNAEVFILSEMDAIRLSQERTAYVEKK